MVNNNFVALCSKAWAIQILIYLYQGGVARVSSIAHELKAGRTSVTASLQHLIKLGYLRRATGHGHPLRPAYVLTPRGEKVAKWATELDDILSAADWSVGRKTWTFPILRLVEPSPSFSTLRNELSPVTDRALSNSLKNLQQKRWISRHVDASRMPVRVSYTPVGKGKILVPCLCQSFAL